MKLRGITATLALGAALSGAAGATAGAAPLRLEPASPVTEPAGPIAEDFTSTGSSTISASVNAKGACLFQRTLSAMDLDC
ncbi:hypothetical protein ACWCPQ_18935 [Nocardia sp. NPDC001965]|uniref:hypothetical protein n=1 Tax=Nocardia sp. NBC_01329 TaxID=2903594 RepID=UPI0017E29D15|nr:hypothetical protein [Nocardia sp.]NUS94998.1 hypothetical protein [Nocardia sp.]WSI99839.1 hypothetical protein OG405_04550 [Nocardia sp. NBC_01329]